jgi:hypothetical protein
MKLGDVVRINFSILGEPKGVLAYVYEVYTLGGDIGGVSLITQNGVDLGGFSKDEQESMLSFVRHSGFYYNFVSVMRLADDWRKGVFKEVFSTENDDHFTKTKVACSKGHEKNCFYAKSDSCECDCNGENHGKAYR